MSRPPTGELLRRQKLTISNRALTVHTVINNNNNNNADYLQLIHLKVFLQNNIIQFLSF